MAFRAVLWGIRIAAAGVLLAAVGVVAAYEYAEEIRQRLGRKGGS